MMNVDPVVLDMLNTLLQGGIVENLLMRATDLLGDALRFAENAIGRFSS